MSDKLIIEYTHTDTFEVDPTRFGRVVLRGAGVKVSDGYHTMDELYAHRIQLFIALARVVSQTADLNAINVHKPVWRSQKHADGGAFEGWYILGIGTERGKQITYHLPDSTWEETAFAKTLDKAPEFDDHTPADVLARLKTI